ncbi:hypothetical protein [Nonomuraea sp. NPDC049480]|uniref:hypothetical protein n=1 Tax=Nonomuraea sp. NPDC049480 TaxID=3364353 RepID=UPI0037934FE4
MAALHPRSPPRPARDGGIACGGAGVRAAGGGWITVVAGAVMMVTGTVIFVAHHDGYTF